MTTVLFRSFTVASGCISKPVKHPRRSISGGGGGMGAASEGRWEVTRARSSLAAAGTVHKRDLSLDDNATAFMKNAQAVS